MAKSKAKKKSAKFIGGPRKKRARGGPGVRLSTHKTRSRWFEASASWPAREGPTAALVHALAADTQIADAPGAAQWECVGPTNIGGRMTSIVCDPANADRIWAGAAGGGVWQSEDAGQTWRPLWHKQEILNVGSLAIDPNHSNILYCGTGEANLSADSYPGVGVFRSTDSGATWTLHAEAIGTGIPRRIGVLAVDSFNSDHLLLGGVGHQPADRPGDADRGGLYVSNNGGVAWQRVDAISPDNYWAHAVRFHPTKNGVIFATITEGGARNGIYRSKNGGASWQHLTNGLPPAPRFGRTSLAISPSNPDILYAQAQDEASGQQDLVLGIFRSDDGGDSWTDITTGHFGDEGQMSYGNSIAVHPTDPDRVICGGVDLHLTTDGGQSWTKVTKWDADRGASNYAHADHHCLLMPAAAPGRIYDMNDGGMDVSDNGGTQWTNRSSGLATNMFYDIDVAQSDGNTFGGGAQDNGTLITATGKADEHFEILGGDGGWIVFDPANAGHLFASYYNFHIFRWRPGQQPVDVSPPASKPEQRSVWMCYITLDPKDAKTAFTGSRRVWRTKDDGNTWKPVSAVLDDSPISAIEVAPADNKRVYVGTENGGLFRSLDKGDTWSADLSGGTLPNFIITRLETSPSNPDILYAAIGGFGHSHIFRSDDGGMSWHDIDQGNLPDVPHHALLIRPDKPSELYVCNDIGVYVSPDLGASWLRLTSNLPNVMVVDLVYQKHDKALFAATYGRSTWRLSLN